MTIEQLLIGSSLRSRIFQGACLFTVGSALNLAVTSARPVFAAGVVEGIVLFLAFNVSFGAVAGAVYYSGNRWRERGGWRRTVANVGSVLVPSTLFLILLGVLSHSG